MNKKIGFIGFGNMAQAIVKGWIKKEVLDPNCIYACAAHYDKLLKTAQHFHINACKDSLSVVLNSDVIIVAVKPNQVEDVLTLLLNELKGKIVISIAAGWDFERFEYSLLKGIHHISTIPNTPISVGEGIIITEEKHSLSNDEMQIFTELFSPIAMIETVDSALLSIGGTLGGCTPAYTAMYLEALADAGVKHGLTRQSAYRIAAKMIVGTGKLYLEYEDHPGMMKDAVCSPGGTTIKGVASLEKNAFRGAVIEAIDAVEE